MDKCQNCGRTIWIWPSGVWTHRKTDAQQCETGPGGDYTKLATPSQPLGTFMREQLDDLARVTESESRLMDGNR